MTHEYPPNRTLDSASVSRVCALREYGLTQRQREFLVTVMVHSGCFLERQYCAFTGTARGQNSREFVARLVRHGFARAIEPGPVRRGRLYHVHHKAECFMASGAAHDRRRRCPPCARRAGGHKAVWTKPLLRRGAMEIESSRTFPGVRGKPGRLRETGSDHRRRGDMMSGRAVPHTRW